MKPKVLMVCVFSVFTPLVGLHANQATASNKPLVILTELSAPSGDTVATQLASTVTSSIGLVMRLTGALRVERVDFLAPSVAFDRALKYYHQANANGAVFGTVKPGVGGSYTIDLTVWNPADTANPTHTIRRRISDLLSSFTIADRLSLEVASTVVGKRLSEGTLVVADVGHLPSYAIYADGHLLGRNRTTYQVLTGKRTIIVAKPGQLGDVPIATFHITIRPGATTTVDLAAVDAAPKKVPTITATPPKPAIAQTATIVVDAREPGRLTIDNHQAMAIKLGRPVSIGGLSMGSHRVRVQFADGTGETRTVSLSRGELLRLTVGKRQPALPLMRLIGNAPIVFGGTTYRAGFFGDYSGITNGLTEFKIPPSLGRIIAKERKQIAAGKVEQIGGGLLATAAGAAVVTGIVLAVQSSRSSPTGAPSGGNLAISVSGTVGLITAVLLARAGRAKSFQAVQSIAGAWNSAATAAQ